MLRKTIPTFLFGGALLSLVIIMLNHSFSSAEEIINQVSSVPACENHGGVNCSIIDPNSSVTCNDGTTDNQFNIYIVPQCKESLEAKTKQDSDFIVQSGCIPPSEMTCINEQSYKNLSKYFANLGVANSELGRGDLIQCRQQITDYQLKNNDYNQCLAENNNKDFVPTAKIVQPLLKAVFCPVFFGNNASYNPEYDLCICDSSYFMYNNICTDASLICQAKYGINTYAQNGACYSKKSTPTPAPISPQKTPSTQAKITPSPSIPLSLVNSPTAQPTQAPYSSSLTEVETGYDTPKTSPSLVVRFFTTLISGLKNILKLL